MIFNVFKEIKFPSSKNYFCLDMIDRGVDKAFASSAFGEPLEESLVNSSNVQTPKAIDYLNLLNDVPRFDKMKQKFEVLE
ncbi:LOW QUALITY PROTEIN: hypothetical protein PanWU01x14_112050 [Parasponia andersonii]|uniref:Uncharacterized protein n=1 Tax=Parasponia andersonii TaxID=3476 RepID=A0A2P5CYN4_PARAD|nr:LOW QUALITY PROTEIN: hypothetical protein PanWU01x14_112050 [Parasponia andersonii]